MDSPSVDSRMSYGMLYSSSTGNANTWSMVGNGPLFWQGIEEGATNAWFRGNQLEPEVIKLPDGSWVMYSQCEIVSGTPIDDPAHTPSLTNVWADRIQVLTSSDGVNWTRKTDRGAIINITTPLHTAFHHEEVIYVPWDKDAKPYWMYVSMFVDGISCGYVRIRSAQYDTFDFNDAEMTSGMLQIGNQIGYLKQAPGGPVFVRITFVEQNGRTVPALQYSRDGIIWNASQNTMQGSSDNLYNKNCYFLGLSTIDGTGEIEYLGNNQWSFLYGATTANSPVALSAADGYGIWKSEIGEGSATLTLNIN